MNVPQIVGICLLRNEEYFAAGSVMNAIEFCDRILVLDHRSEDRTRTIVDAIAARHSKVEVHEVDDAYDTHRYVEPCVATATWMLSIDGDEIFDPVGLSRLRRRIRGRELDFRWFIETHYLHALGIDAGKSEAFGFNRPDAPFLVKRFNLEAMTRWSPGKQERFHATKRIEFRRGYSHDQVHDAPDADGWATADLRCPHLCFRLRSSIDAFQEDDGELFGRDNPLERKKAEARRWRIRRALLRPFVSRHRASHKSRHYAQGDVIVAGVSNFGAVTDHRADRPALRRRGAGARRRDETACASQRPRRARARPRSGGCSEKPVAA